MNNQVAAAAKAVAEIKKAESIERKEDNPNQIERKISSSERDEAENLSIKGKNDHMCLLFI